MPTADPLTEPLEDPAFWAGDPFPHLARLRAEAPVAWNAEHGYWALSRHRDVLAVATDPDRFVSGRGILVSEIGHEYPSPPTIMHTDPPDHTRYRALVQPAFRPSIMRGMEARVRDRFRTLVDRIEPDTPVDLVAELAVPFPLQVISDLLDIPDADVPRFYQWSEAAVPGAGEFSDDERLGLLGDMTNYLLAVAEDRRLHPGDDVVSDLAKVTVEGHRLDDAELAMFLIQLLVAGNETTRNLLSGSIVAFSERPDQWQRLREHPGLRPTAVEELLRWTSPVSSFLRTAVVDTEVGGQAVAAGEPLLLLYASANRDEAEFGSTADSLDIGRDPNHHLAFGFGAHFCIGAALARIEARVALEELAARFSGFEVDAVPVRSPSSVIGGYRSVRVVPVAA